MEHNQKTYMILADTSEEFDAALRYAAICGKKKGVKIAILYVIGETDFQHWGMIEERMKQELRTQADNFIKIVKSKIFDIGGVEAEAIIEEGKKSDAIIKTIENNKHISKLILAGSTSPSGPGPLIEYFAGKGMENLKVTLTIVPGHLSNEEIEHLV